MAEGGILEKFPDSWDPQYLWSVVVEYLSNDHPVDILIKRLVFLLLFAVLCSDLGQITMCFAFVIHFYVGSFNRSFRNGIGF